MRFLFEAYHFIAEKCKELNAREQELKSFWFPGLDSAHPI